MQQSSEKVETETVNTLKEELYIGNLHHEHNNNHYWTMFVSTSPTDVVPPSTISRVTYYLHQTFRPNMVTVKEPPFYLPRIGWGYFDVKADIIFKRDVYVNDIETDQKSNTLIPCDSEPVIRASHSIHFGSPLVTHHIQTNLPYVVDASSLQKAIIKQREYNDLQHELNRQKQTAAAEMRAITGLSDPDGDTEDTDPYDCITKPYIQEIVLSGFCLTPQNMRETLTAHMAPKTPKEVIDLIVAYASIYSIGPDDRLSKKELLKTRIVLKNCFSSQCVVYCPVLELVVINCGGCEIQYSDIRRTVRVYNCTSINLYNKGECSSYRFEKCKNVTVEALDVRMRVIFMSLFSENLCFKMFNAYFPNDSSKCVAEFPPIVTAGSDDIGNERENERNQEEMTGDDHDNVDGTSIEGGVIDGWKKWFVKANTECYLTVFRKDNDVSEFGSMTYFPAAIGTSLIPFI